MRLAILAVTIALALPAGALEMRMVLLPIRGLEGEANTQSRIVLVRNLRERGAILTPVADYQAAAEAAGYEADRLADPEVVRAIAPQLGVDAVLDLEVRPRQRPPGREANLRVLESTGEVIWQGSVPHPEEAVNQPEAQALTGFAIGALGPGGRIQWERVVEPVLNAAPEPVTPTPESLGFSRLAANLHLTFRNASTDPANGGPAVDFTTGFPYAGLELDFEWFRFPLPEAVRPYIGAGIRYSYSPLRIGVDIAPGVTERIGAADHRFDLDAIGQTPWLHWGGQFRFETGFSYQGFIHDQVANLVPTSHTAVRFAAAYLQDLPWWNLRLAVRGGIRPWASVGQGLPDLYGDTVSSFGTEARVTLSGSLENLAPNLRWMAGYDLLAWRDRLGDSADPTAHAETYNRIFVGVGYELLP